MLVSSIHGRRRISALVLTIFSFLFCLNGSVQGFVSARPSRPNDSPPAFTSKTSSNNNRPEEKKSFLRAEISFKGESVASLDLDAPEEEVRAWLMTPSKETDAILLGTPDAYQTQPDKDPDLWECKQPKIDFLGLDLQPSFTNRLERKNGQVRVEVVDSKTEILKKSRANNAVAGIMGRSKFAGESLIQVLPPTAENGQRGGCTLKVDFNLVLKVRLPPLVPLPPGFNSLGSGIVSRSGKSRTQQLLSELRDSYEQYCKTSE